MRAGARLPRLGRRAGVVRASAFATPWPARRRTGGHGDRPPRGVLFHDPLAGRGDGDRIVGEARDPRRSVAPAMPFGYGTVRASRSVGARMDAAVQIRLFGAFSARVGQEVVPEGAWRLRKAKSLVKLLALAPARRIHRERATELLWPERAPAAAANNFHQALYVARRALEAAGAEASAVLQLRDDMLALYPGGRVGGRRRRLRGGRRPRSPRPASCRTVGRR